MLHLTKHLDIVRKLKELGTNIKYEPLTDKEDQTFFVLVMLAASTTDDYGQNELISGL